jgi:shikimate kinase
MAIAVLIGPPGSGKSSIGRALAKLLQQDFVDTDALIEEQEGKSIREIFQQSGEEKFREIESAVVTHQLVHAEGIIALGGGAVLSTATQASLKNSMADVVFLNVSASNAVPRVSANSSRPLLSENPSEQWSALLKERLPIYIDLADITIDTDNKKAQEVAIEIAAFLKELA